MSKSKPAKKKQSVTVTMTSDTASLMVTENKQPVHAVAAKHAHSAVADFVDFLRSQGVIGLAIAVVLGAAVTKLVGSLVTDIINPIIGIIIGKAGNLSSYSLKIGSAEVMWGKFIATLIDFVVVALVVYGFVKILKLDKLDKKKE